MPAHHYVFRVAALSSPSGLADGATVQQVDAAISVRAVANGFLAAVYGR